MGLPIFITPVEPEVASRAAEKVAAIPRSSIRRQRTIRGGSQARSAENQRRRIDDLLEIEARENGQTSAAGPGMASIASLHARAHRLMETERALSEQVPLSDPVSWERRHTPNGGYPNALPPVPDPELESRVERENEHRRQVRASREREIERLHQVRRDLRRLGRRRPAPTPPYTDADIDHLMPMMSSRIYREPFVPPSALTPARSPARLSPLDGEAEVSSVRDSRPEDPSAPSLVATRTRYRLRDERLSRSAAQADLAERVDAFTRAPRGSPSNAGPTRSFRQFLRQANLDGLGDRDRSLSPEGGSAWDTLLTSITPDPQAPSAGSSFASTTAAAAAATSSSNSGPTWGSAPSTSLTTPEITGESSALRDCDESNSSDSDTEDEELEDLNNLLRSHHREDRLWRSSYADVARANRGAQSPDTSLEGMARIISRLAERDDIPESWWASVGLRRDPSA